jgi:drug/metabolite transporter (DMT)-like permease
METIGITLCFLGLCITILGRDGGVSWSNVQPDMLRVGVLAGLGVAICQAVAMVLIKSALQMGADPVAASALRVTLAAVLVSPPAYGRGKTFANLPQPFRPLLFGTLASALAVNGAGMIFLTLAIADSNLLASASSLCSLAPVAVVPIMWALTGHAPTPLTALGVIVAVAGTVLIFDS